MKLCGNCKSFELDYIMYRRDSFSEKGYGHCIRLELKDKLDSDKPCKYWKENKNYLTEL